MSSRLLDRLVRTLPRRSLPMLATRLEARGPALLKTQIAPTYNGGPISSARFSSSSSSSVDAPKSPSLIKNLIYGAPSTFGEVVNEVIIDTREDNVVYEVVTHHITPGRQTQYLELITPIYRRISDTASSSSSSSSSPSSSSLNAKYGGTQLVGSWRQVTGDVDTYIHIWRHPSFTDYHNAKRTIENCDDCKELESEKLSSLLRSRCSELVQAVGLPLWKNQIPPIAQPSSSNSSTGSIFELRIYNLKPGKFHHWEHTWHQGLQCRQEVMKPVGAWFTQLGDLNKVYHLWQFEDLEHRRAARQKCWDLPGWADSVEETAKVTKKMVSNILVPLEISPLK